jgi:phage shock protein E
MGYSEGKSSPYCSIVACCLGKYGKYRVMKYFLLSAAVMITIVSSSSAVESEIVPVSIDQAERAFADGAQLLDVRTKEEWNEGHLKGAILVTITQEEFLKNAKVKLDPKKPVVVYCRSGRRSAMATEQLRTAGFTVLDLDGGIIAWQAAGKPVVK